MDRKHILLRFFPKKEYLEQFLSGSLYMNSMHYFWGEYKLEYTKRRKMEIIKIDITSDSYKDKMLDKMDKLFFRKIEKKYKASDCGYYGTVSREELRDMFYALGNNEAEMFITIGSRNLAF